MSTPLQNQLTGFLESEIDNGFDLSMLGSPQLSFLEQEPDMGQPGSEDLFAGNLLSPTASTLLSPATIITASPATTATTTTTGLSSTSLPLPPPPQKFYRIITERGPRKPVSMKLRALRRKSNKSAVESDDDDDDDDDEDSRSTSSSSTTRLISHESSVNKRSSSNGKMTRTLISAANKPVVARKTLPQHSGKRIRSVSTTSSSAASTTAPPSPRKYPGKRLVAIAQKQPRQTSAAGSGTTEDKPARGRHAKSLKLIGDVDPNPSNYDFWSENSRLLTDAGDVDYIAKQIAQTRVLRFVKSFITEMASKRHLRLTTTTTAIQLLKFMAIDHVYHMLRTFAFIFKSIKESSLLSGSFLPDYMQILDPHYDDYEAMNFCKARRDDMSRSVTRTIRPRNPRGNIGFLQDQKRQHDRRKMEKQQTQPPQRFYIESLPPSRRKKPAPTDEAGTTAAASTVVATRKSHDLSCILVSNKRLLSAKVFYALKQRLNSYYSNTSGHPVDFKVTKQFAIEVNQAFVYFLWKALTLAIDVAQNRVGQSKNSFRLVPRDIAYAFSLIPPPYGQTQMGPSNATKRRHRARQQQQQQAAKRKKSAT